MSRYRHPSQQPEHPIHSRTCTRSSRKLRNFVNIQISRITHNYLCLTQTAPHPILSAKAKQIPKQRKSDEEQPHQTHTPNSTQIQTPSPVNRNSTPPDPLSHTTLCPACLFLNISSSALISSNCSEKPFHLLCNRTASDAFFGSINTSGW